MLHPRVCCVSRVPAGCVYASACFAHVCMYGPCAWFHVCVCVHVCVHRVSVSMPGLPCEVLGALTLEVRNGQGPVEERLEGSEEGTRS